VLVVRIQNDVVACEDVIARERERNAARAGVSGKCGNHEVGIGRDDVLDEIVDRLKVAPGLLAWVVGGLDLVEMDAV
jgi:hypothetical protein